MTVSLGRHFPPLFDFTTDFFHDTLPISRDKARELANDAISYAYEHPLSGLGSDFLEHLGDHPEVKGRHPFSATNFLTLLHEDESLKMRHYMNILYEFRRNYEQRDLTIQWDNFFACQGLINQDRLEKN